MKNKIYAEDFGSLEIESLKIDYLRFNLKSYLNDSEISNLAVYFRRLRFSSYKKERDNIKERTAIFNDKYFEVTFVLRTPYFVTKTISVNDIRSRNYCRSIYTR